MQPPSDQVISVSAFIEILNETLNFAFPAVTVEGEVSSFKVNQSKWVFFDLKDDEATLPCFMPVFQLKVPLEDGMRVRVTGVPKLTKWGKFSFTAKSVSLAGEGELKRAFQLLKERLSREGLFAEERKRALPNYPQTIGLVTSAASAAYADFIKVLGQRWGGVRIQLADVQVQGASSPDQVVGAIDYFNQLPVPPDVLVIIRGGGSLEDLQSFNTEAVARAIAGSRTPTLVGVGHEVDTTLADFAADKRAATPTDAARLVVPDRHQVQQAITHYQARLQQGIDKGLRLRYESLHQAVARLERFIRVPQARLQHYQSALMNAERNLIRNQRQKLDALARLLASFDPKATLKRGYAIVRHDNTVITRPAQVKIGDALVVQLAEGNINTTVND